ncbi:uncharacterized protein JCM10292_000993 [Rhodotorula paludigena]|uniref:uncharacterized protein n=1 Tax=Rhodotorula paludigena TaxID=86838 RepID=UPI00317C534B
MSRSPSADRDASAPQTNEGSKLLAETYNSDSHGQDDEDKDGDDAGGDCALKGELAGGKVGEEDEAGPEPSNTSGKRAKRAKQRVQRR